MDALIAWIMIPAMFVFGVRLSAFFSGSEIGFYRLSLLRLSIEADAGNRTAQRLLKFVQNPSYFVATTLVGNNVANFLTTLAISMGVVTLFHTQSTGIEIAGTLLMTPFVFVFGELIPKNLYFSAPHKLLYRDAAWFWFFYRLLLVISFPLVWISKLIEKMGRPDRTPAQLALGRKRLVQVLTEGHQAGLLTQVQNQLVHGLLTAAPQPVIDIMTPTEHVLGVREDADRKAVFEFARRHGQADVPVRKTHRGRRWFGYIRVVDLAMHERPIQHDIRPLVKIDAAAGKLEALLALRSSGERYGVVMQSGKVVGLVTEKRLVEQLFQPRQTVARR